jgi:hypothetical protein
MVPATESLQVQGESKKMDKVQQRVHQPWPYSLLLVEMSGVKNKSKMPWKNENG